MFNKKFYQKIIKHYNIEKMSIKGRELFEIVNKYEFYKQRTEIWYLKPMYEVVYLLSILIAKSESKNAFEK